jgi:hypothetical protein
MTVEEILKFLRERRDDYDDPGGYMEEEWYIKCSAKVDILEEVINTIERRCNIESKL